MLTMYATTGGGAKEIPDPQGPAAGQQNSTPHFPDVEPMAYPRTPLAKAKATGQTLKNPKRFNSRREPNSLPLGNPSKVLDEMEVEAWEAFKVEVPWLSESDRATVEAACMMRAKLWGGSRDEKVVGRLLSLLSRMGATPADRSKVYAPKDDEEADPAEAYLQ